MQNSLMINPPAVVRQDIKPASYWDEIAKTCHVDKDRSKPIKTWVSSLFMLMLMIGSVEVAHLWFRFWEFIENMS